MSGPPTPTASTGERALLAVGFLALTGALAGAHGSPATGYERSLYAATPVAVWALLAAALGLSLVVALVTRSRVTRRFALVLGGGATLAVVALPVLRGYWFLSGGDGHTHLGWARGIAAGAYHPADLRYPGLHTSTIFVGRTLGIDLAHAMLLVIVALCAIFFCFVTLTTSLFFESRYSAVFGAFSAFCLLPITTLSTFLSPHAMSQAILFSTAVVFVLFAYARRGAVGSSGRTYWLLAALLLVALVLYHPQHAAHVLVVLGTTCALQWVARRYERPPTIASHAPLYGLTLVLVAAFLVWSANHELIQSVVQFHVESTIEFLLGANDAAGDSVGAQADSLSAVGGSLALVVLKLLGPNVVFGLLSGLLILGTLLGVALRRRHQTRATIAYLTAGLAGLSVLFFLYFFGSSGMMYFRVFGFMMLFITVLGALALAASMESISVAPARGVAHVAVSVAFAVLLAASLAGVFASPYIYSPTAHVTEQSMTAHANAFDAADEDVGFVGIRSGPNRYADAYYAPLDRTSGYRGVSGEEIESGFADLESDRYLVVRDADYEREVEVYRELRYTAAQLESIPTQPGVDRIQSSGEVTVYYLSGGAPEA
ncbi:hypothetical protein [Halovivax limisalsi]|uniref:hypothetical protein n=1 Tax=Halovivax limisalsi TaxID=1453760 RepID=UPI001FFC52D0|nr:hypothetical protein [Halovivax limisalsi]